MTAQFRPFRFALAFSAFLLVVPAAHSQVFNWTSAASGNWSGGTWSPGVPTFGAG